MRYSVFVFLLFTFFAGASSAATLQIDDNGTDGQWDENNATQTGSVGSVDVQLVTTQVPWEENGYTNENYPYAGDQFGSLAQPGGTSGDGFNQQIGSSTGAFSWTLTFLDAVSDVVIYISDIDKTGAILTVASGYSDFYFNADFAKSGDMFTVISGSNEGTLGGNVALFYDMDFASGESLVFLLDFSNVDIPGGENIGLGIATVGDGPPGPSPIPLPATGLLLLVAVGGLSALRIRA
ncbi:hypothetical protein [Ovoidimarina sediminis]|uniref:hypothetical protein n=1 Tax=Ovoidimarina sediminis TaxID=3079856 RepID=UPI0029149A43|nr:hypothetical protein [Rhodophyticola sp. MJ-SS7]MDU8946450.1 hypothetical protein [Rhodophyticola sp. MJ-SS7]